MNTMDAPIPKLAIKAVSPEAAGGPPHMNRGPRLFRETISAMPSPKKPPKQPSDPCAECGSLEDVIQGERFLTVEAEWRPQPLCTACANRLRPEQFRRRV